MLSNSESHKLMARGTLEDWAPASIERSRQLVAVNNFLWMADQQMWRNQNDKAGKMIRKASGVATRMAEEDAHVLKEIAQRSDLLREREAFAAQFPPEAAPRAQLHMELVQGNSVEFEAVRHARCEVFCGELGMPEAMECDGLDDRCSHLVAYMGDCVMGSARLWPYQLDAQPAVVVDRLFVLNAYRGEGLGARLLAMSRDAAGATARLVVCLRADFPYSQALIPKLQAAGGFASLDCPIAGSVWFECL
jgi:predicted GNAT family N-acyltransferase